MDGVRSLGTVLLILVLALLLVACGPEAWEQDPDVRAASRECGKEYDCIERHAVETLNPEVCRLAGIAIDDMCLQAVYEAADDPAICGRIYLQGVRPNCQAYYADRAAGAAPVPSSQTSSPTPSGAPVPPAPASPTPVKAAPTLAAVPRQPEVVSEGLLACTPLNTFARCSDDILNIEFEVPASWGAIETRLTTGGYAGLAYNYFFGGKTHAETEPLVAGGRSVDFDEGRGAMPTDFPGYDHPGFRRKSACDFSGSDWFDNSFPVCRQVTDKVAWMIRLPNAATLCEAVFGYWQTDPVFRVEVNLPDNPTINGFVFEAPFFSEQFAAQVENDLYPLLDVRRDERPSKCDDASRQAFDAKRVALIESITDRTADAETLEKVDELLHLAESITWAQATAATTTPYLGTDFVISCHEVYPGLNCSSDVEPMAGARLAFVDPRPGLDGRPNAIDLENKELQVLGEEASSLAGWSPSGQHLLTRQAEGRFTVYSFDGTALKELTGLPAEPFWAPPDAFFGAVDWLAVPEADGALQAVPLPAGEARTVLPAGSLGADGRGRVLWAAGGRLAWTPSLDQWVEAGEGEQVLHVGRADGNAETITWRLSDDVQAAYYQLVDWVPGTSLLLAGRGMLANSAWSWGVPLVAIDAGTGEVRDLGASMLLTPESHAWHPTRPGLLALAEGGSRYLSDPNRLALLDVTTGELRALTGEGLSVFEPAWSPDGSLLAYAAVAVPPDAEGGGEVLEGLLAGRAVYVVDPESGDSRAVTDPGEAIDGWPRWSPAPHRGDSGDARLLYTRQHDGYTDVRVVRLDGTSDELFLTGLPGPTCFYGGCGWDRMLAYDADGVDDVMHELLDDYSQALSSGQVVREELYTHMMRALVEERRGYYRQFHEVAFHSSLLGIESRYGLDSIVPDAVDGSLYHVRAVEWLTTTGRYLAPRPEEYTPTRAALWALARTDHPGVQEALQVLIDRQMREYLARLGIGRSYETVWILRHHLLARDAGDRFVLVQDAYDDKANDNEDGIDVVEWVDGRFQRHRPDLTAWPDYAIYHEPLKKIEAEGRRLLTSYTRRYGDTPAPDSHPGWLTYTHPIHGFSFRYPPGWQVDSSPAGPNFVRVRPRSGPDVELAVGVRRPDEDVPIQRTGVGAGDVETRGSARFLGREVAREVLVYEGKVKAVLYNNAVEIDVDGLVFTLSLDSVGPDYDAVDIPPDVQAIVDKIVGSFLLTFGLPDP